MPEATGPNRPEIRRQTTQQRHYPDPRRHELTANLPSIAFGLLLGFGGVMLIRLAIRGRQRCSFLPKRHRTAEAGPVWPKIS
jgi:hypothetical protein